MTGRDPSKWTFGGWWYNDAYYPTHEAFRAAWSVPGFEKPEQRNVTDEAWYGTDRIGEELPFDKQPPPMHVQPGRQRFAVDKEQGYVEWGERGCAEECARSRLTCPTDPTGPFSMYITFSRDTGLRLFDIRFGTSGDAEKKRIIYELGMDEAVAHCASASPSYLTHSLTSLPRSHRRWKRS